MKSYIFFSAALKKIISMCAENPLLGKLFVPSFFICLVLCGSILLASTHFLDGRINPAGAIILALSGAVFVPVYCNALKINGAPGRTGKAGSAARALIVIVLAGMLSVLICVVLHERLCGEDDNLGRENWTAQVTGLIEKRYYHEAEIRFWKTVDSATIRNRPFLVHSGIARITGGGVCRSDMIKFSAGPITIRERAKKLSPRNRSLLLRGIRYLFYLDGRSVEIVKAGSSFRERARKGIAANCDRLFNRDTSSMVKALYFGNQDYIAKTTMNDFKRAGVFHILSAGGLHVGVIAAIPLFLLGIVRVNRRIMMAAAVIAVFLYLCMTDAPVCLLRSCIMFFMYAAQRIAGREVNIFNTLFLSCAVILVLYPHEIFGLGFQLSYGATLGILLFHGLYRKSMPRLPGFISDPLALTLSAQLPVLPILLVRLNELNLMGLLSNVIVVPLMSLLLVASLAAHAVSPLALTGLWAGRAVNAIFGLSGAIVEFLSGLDGHFYVEAAGPALVAAFCLLAAPLLPRLRSFRFISLCVVAAVAVAWLSLGAGGSRESMTVVRHGSGSLVMVKKGTRLSIAGRVPDRNSIDRFMKIIAASSARDIELYVTDPDYRNIAGYTSLLRRLPVRSCYLSDSFRIRGYSRRFMDVIERDRVLLIIPACDAAAGPDDICSYYRKVSAGEALSSCGASSKNVEIQYLTLH